MATTGFCVVVKLEPRPPPSLGLDERFTRVDYTSTCTLLDVLTDMARVLRVPEGEITLLQESGGIVNLQHTLVEHHDQHAEPCSSLIAWKCHQWPPHVKRQRKEIKLKVKHTPPSHQLVTCTVEGGEGRNKLRSATVQLPNTATFGELLEQGRQKRYGALEFEGPVYGRNGELDITLRDAWVRNGCKIDGISHIGLAVVVSFPLESQKPLPLIMGPGDAVNDVKRRVCIDRGLTPSRQTLMLRGGAQQLEDSAALTELLVSGVPVGGFSSAGWGELHLELRIKECVFPLDCKLRATLGHETGAGGWSSGEKTPFTAPSPSSQSCSDDMPRILRPVRSARSTSPAEPVALRSDPSVSLMPEVGHLRDGSGSFDGWSSRCGGGSGGGAFSMVVFALSPSGRALTLTMRAGATVLDAKLQVACLEGVPPCRQRLLWRGIRMEPESALLHGLGVRSGDTLIVGYRMVSRKRPEAMAPVVEVEVNARDDALVAEMTASPSPSYSHQQPGAGSGNSTIASADHATVAEPVELGADGGERREIVAREDGGALNVDEDARAQSIGATATPGVESNSGMGDEGGGGEGEEGGGEGGGEGREIGGESGVGGAGRVRVSSLPSNSSASQGHQKEGRRLTWWSRKKFRRMRRGRASEDQGGSDRGRTGLGGTATSPASSPPAISSDANASSAIMRRSRVSPAPESPVQPNPTDDTPRTVRGIGAESTGATTARASPRPALSPSMGRPNFPWGRWKQGRRLPGCSRSG